MNMNFLKYAHKIIQKQNYYPKKVIYQLTPAGRWMNNGLRGDGRRIGNSLYSDETNGLLFKEPMHDDLISYNIGYEAV
ncbi:unnamed protein product [Plasmodium vivax]|uniref:(malaria parasite P. vivax) hypothetical protein n=1 Tax=Plasmodium vivax TaxID=5855 RepID=A0A8S4H874_PLAVI|nr:unnamed protein product [Plasmodium vivax]